MWVVERVDWLKNGVDGYGTEQTNKKYKKKNV